MALLRFACLALVAACYQPNPPAGAPCSGEGEECPFGQSCIRGTCRVVGPTGDAAIEPIDAFVPDGPPADLDADGRPNTADNCPSKYNPDQHDEDGDAVGDVCDNCPHVANANQANTGEGALPDAVGDACDPRPQTPGDTIQKFYAFNAVPPGTFASGTWAVDGDTYRFAGGIGSLTVEGVRNRIGWLAGTMEITDARHVRRARAGEANNEGYSCGYYDYGGDQTDFHAALISYFNGQSGDTTSPAATCLQNRLSGAFTIRMTADSTANRITCTTIDAPRDRGLAGRQRRPAGAGNVSVLVEDGTSGSATSWCSASSQRRPVDGSGRRGLTSVVRALRSADRDLARQLDRERGALAELGLDLDRAAVALDELVHDRQAEAGALADVLGGEERIPDPRQDLGRDARAVVADLDLDAVRRRRVVSIVIVASLAPGERLRGVGQEVHEHLVDLAGVAAHAADVAVLLARP